MKKVYFACSIRGGRNDAATYAHIVEYLKTKATVLSEIFADGSLTPQGSPGKTSDIYKKDLGWVKQADLVIAEVTHPSLGVGYEIAKAEEWGIPVLALFRSDSDQKLSAMIDGSPHTRVVYYQKLEEVESAIDKILNE